MDRPLVLIVDDEALICGLLEDAFEQAGFDVASVFSGVDAINDLGGSQSFAALVSDVNLGGEVDGWAVAVTARQADPDIPVVYVTGDSAADWSAFGVPNSLVIQKPFVVAQIVTAVMTLMNGRPAATVSAIDG
ncbi:MAG: response regulator [Brevundimonas sp.]|nr:MAG: response regulator [Brevundimonas sp.]